MGLAIASRGADGAGRCGSDDLVGEVEHGGGAFQKARYRVDTLDSRLRTYRIEVCSTPQLSSEVTPGLPVNRSMIRRADCWLMWNPSSMTGTGSLSEAIRSAQERLQT